MKLLFHHAKSSMKRIIKFHETLFHNAKSSMKILFHQSVMKILLIMIVIALKSFDKPLTNICETMMK